MLDQFTIFTQGGTVLYSHSFSKVKGAPVNSLIKSVFLEERFGEESFSTDQYSLKWLIANEIGIAFVAVYQKILQLLYVEDLLEAVRQDFCSLLDDMDVDKGSISQGYFRKIDYHERFLAIMREAEMNALQQKNKVRSQVPRRFEQTAKYKHSRKAQIKGKGEADGASTDGHDADISSAPPSPTRDEDDKSASSSAAADVKPHDDREEERLRRNNLERLKASGRISGRGAGRGRKKGSGMNNPFKAILKDTPQSASPTKSEKKQAALDMSKDKEDPENENVAMERHAQFFKGTGHTDLDAEYGSSESERDDQDGNTSTSDERGYDASASEAETSGKKGKKGEKSRGFFQMFSGIVGGSEPLTEESLEPVVAKFREHLTAKNVALEIAEKLCESVVSTLVGRKLATLERVQPLVKRTIEEALNKILTPKRNIDVLRDVAMAKEQGRPYTVVFVGVNGVGKSTSLAKVASWMQSHKLKVRIAACDTFRSGAVEQLKVHARCLDIPLFEKGYGKDAASIAAEAVKDAQNNHDDVVLIDTAGRMQDNEPLMRALAKLISYNKPDLVLFVGEALVGNEAVDQLLKFNQALIDFAPVNVGTPRAIDGILLTKCDTIDDKVGAAVSMVYATGQPIIFVGIGQTYPDLRRFNAQTVIKALLK